MVHSTMDRFYPELYSNEYTGRTIEKKTREVGLADGLVWTGYGPNFALKVVILSTFKKNIFIYMVVLENAVCVPFLFAPQCLLGGR